MRIFNRFILIMRKILKLPPKQGAVFAVWVYPKGRNNIEIRVRLYGTCPPRCLGAMLIQANHRSIELARKYAAVVARSPEKRDAFLHGQHLSIRAEAAQGNVIVEHFLLTTEPE